MWKSGSLENKLSKQQHTTISSTLKTRPATKFGKTRNGKVVHSNHIEANGERKLDNDMPTFKIELQVTQTCVLQK